MQETDGAGHMLKRQLMDAAQPLSEQSFTIVSWFSCHISIDVNSCSVFFSLMCNIRPDSQQWQAYHDSS